MFADIIEFHEKFGLVSPEVPAFLPIHQHVFREKFMQEELNEFIDASETSDMIKAADALADLVYVALGTGYLMGLPMVEIWDAVHRANMTKVRALRKDQSKRGSTFDVVKPAGFVGPEQDIEALLHQYGWRG